MYNFLFELAMMRYQMYHELFKFKPYASRSEDCFERIKYLSRYEQVLQIINLLPPEQKQEMNKIEQEHFLDAPYVVKL